MMGWQGISWLEVKRYGVREIHSGTSRGVLLARHCSARAYDERELATRNISSSSSLFIIPFADSGLLFFTLDRPFWRSFCRDSTQSVRIKLTSNLHHRPVNKISGCQRIMSPLNLRSNNLLNHSSGTAITDAGLSLLSSHTGFGAMHPPSTGC